MVEDHTPTRLVNPFKRLVLVDLRFRLFRLYSLHTDVLQAPHPPTTPPHCGLICIVN